VSSVPPAEENGATHIVEASDGWALATRGRLVVTVWRNDVTFERVRSVDRVIRALLPRCGEAGYGSITVIEPGISMRMNDDARAASTDLQKRYARQMKCSGYLVEGTGFVTATVRTMTAGMHLLTRSPYPIRVFAMLPDVAAWVAPHVALDESAVVRAVFEVRGAGLPRA
jgi:hypothetical protein